MGTFSYFLKYIINTELTFAVGAEEGAGMSDGVHVLLLEGSVGARQRPREVAYRGILGLICWHPAPFVAHDYFLILEASKRFV